MLKIAFWLHKLTQRAHVWLEGVKQSWNTTGIQSDHVEPFMPGDLGEKVGRQALKSGKKRPKKG